MFRCDVADTNALPPAATHAPPGSSSRLPSPQGVGGIKNLRGPLQQALKQMLTVNRLRLASVVQEPHGVVFLLLCL